jgi:hypothetical protein
MRKLLVTLFVALTLVACATPPAGPRPQPQFAYAAYPRVPVNVAHIKVVNNSRMPMVAPHIEQELPMAVSDALAQWANTRFQPIGADGTLTITINDAQVVRGALARTNGVQGWFTVDQAEKIAAKAVVSLQADGLATDQRGQGQVSTQRSHTLAEDASLQVRDNVYVQITEAIVQDIDASTQKLLADKLRFLLGR